MTTSNDLNTPNWKEKVWCENASQIYKLCSNKSRDNEVVKDLFQDVALRFCKSSPDLDTSKSVLPWFAKVVNNTFYECYRKYRKVTPISHLKFEPKNNIVAESVTKYRPLFNSMVAEIEEERRERYIRKELD